MIRPNDIEGVCALKVERFRPRRMVLVGSHGSGSPTPGSVLYRLALWGCLLLGLTGPAHADSVQPVSVVRVLMLYTPQASAGAGGTLAMLNQIDAAMVEANTVFQNSLVRVRLQLALAARINYVESGSVSNDLARLRNPGRGILAQAHRLRDQFNADLVCLITESGSDWWFYGLQGPSADNAFSLVRRPYLTGNYYLPVALSFNFGCQLERPFADSVGAFPYAYGYSFWANDTLFSTVEAFSGQRLPFFSNPDLSFEGVPLGVPDGLVNAADNALVMNHTAPLVAAFRGSATRTLPPRVSITAPTPAATFPAGTKVLLSASATDPDGKVVRVDYYEGTNRLTSSGTAPFRAWWFNVPLGEHGLFAVATDNAGATTVSDLIPITVVPANDDFAARAQITSTDSTIRASNALASAEPDEPDHAGFPAAHSMWWTYTAPAAGVVTLDASASSFQPSLAVYGGDALNALTEVASTSGMDGSALRFPVAAQQVCQIALDGPDGETGDLEFSLRFATSPANDNFASRRPLSGNHLRVRADNRGATREPDEPDHSGTPGSASLWWSWTAPSAGQFTLTPSSAGGANWLVGVYTGSALTNLTPAPALSQYPASWVVTAEKGVSYQIAVDSPVDPLQPGPFELDLSFQPEPVNDHFAGRLPISGTQITLSEPIALATIEPGTPINNGMPALWWSWTAPRSGYVRIDCFWNQFIDVFTGADLMSLTPIASGSPASFAATAGTTYAIAVSGLGGTVALNLTLSTLRIVTPTEGWTLFAGHDLVLGAVATPVDGRLQQVQFFANDLLIGTARHAPYRVAWHQVPAGNYALTVVGSDSSGHTRSSPPVNITVQYPPPRNDHFAARTGLSGAWISLTNSDVAATSEPGEPNIAGTPWRNSIWWSWTAPLSGRVTLSTTTVLTALGVYTGDSVSNLTAVAGGYATVNFDASAGTTYNFAAVGSENDVVLQLVLSGLRLVSPADGAHFVTGSTIPLVADVTAAEQPVRRVEFFRNDVSLGIVTNPPHTLAWTNAPGGVWSITAVATDDAGHSRTSSAVSVWVSPPNDDFRDRIALFGQVVHTNGSTAGATEEPSEPNHDGQTGNMSVWYSWTAPDSDRYSVVFDTYGAFVPWLAIYTGSDLADLTLVSSNAYWRSAAFSAQAGSNYVIALDGAGAGGNDAFSLDILKPPANDTFAHRTAITNANHLVLGNNLGATSEPGEPLVAYYGGQSIWWTWTAPKAGVVTFATQATESLPILHVYTGSSVSNLTPLPGQVGGPWDEINDLAFDVQAGTSYAISADGKWNVDWSVVFALNFTPRPDNDAFANATPLTGTNVVIHGDNRTATPESGEPQPAGDPGGHSVWYSWTAPTRSFATVTATSTNFTPLVEAFTGTNVAALTPVGTNSTSGVSFVAAAGIPYQIAVGGSGGFFTLNLSSIPPPANDAFDSRGVLLGMNPTVHGTTFLASLEPGEPGFAPWLVDGSVWYSWVAPADGTVRVHCPTRPITVCRGGRVSSLTVVAPPNGANFDDLVFSAVAGTEYAIGVAGAAWLPDDFTLSLVVPKAQIASPAAGSVFPSAASFEIVARTIDLDGAVVSVSFFDATNLLATVTNAPFQMDYRNVPAGSHHLWLQALDQHGLTTTSEPVEVRVKPANDNFAQRIAITGASATLAADNSGATTELGETLPGGATGRTLWWTWTAPSTGTVTITTSAFSAAAATATRTPHAAALQPASHATTGQIQPKDVVIINPNPGPPGPTIGPLIAVYTGSTVTNLTLYASNSIWFNEWWTPVPYGSVTNGGEWCVLPSSSFPVVGGQTYQLSLDGVNGSSGAASIGFSFVPPPVPPAPPINDNFLQSTPLSGSSLTIAGTTVGATREFGEPSHGLDPAARTVWYSWTAAASGSVLVTATASGYSDLGLGVYAGAVLWDLTPVATGTDQTAFYALAGLNYKIVVAGPSGLAVGFSLALDGPPPPPALDLAHTLRLPNGSFQIRVTGFPGQSFVLQGASDSMNWTTIHTDTLLTSYLDFIDTTATRFGRRFYRVLSLEAAFNNLPFTLLAAGFQPDTGFSLHLSGMSGLPFRLQVSTNLWDWSDLTNGVLANGAFDFTDQDALNVQRRFYRALP